MENKLKTLFDFQKFEDNAALRSLINATHSRYSGKELDLDDMDFVAAAGIPEILSKDSRK